MTVPPQCEPLVATIDELEAERRDLQTELQSADTGQKARLATAIKALNQRIQGVRDDLVDCIATAPPAPTPAPPLAATLSGRATLTTTSPHAPDPVERDVEIGLVFDGARTFVGISSFPTIESGERQTPFGPNKTTVSKIGGGTSSFVNRHIAMPLTLRFDNSVDLFIGDSDLSLVLATFPNGQAVSATGELSATGTGTFSEGILGGSQGTLTIRGTINPAP